MSLSLAQTLSQSEGWWKCVDARLYRFQSMSLYWNLALTWEIPNLAIMMKNHGTGGNLPRYPTFYTTDQCKTQDLAQPVPGSDTIYM